MATTNWLTNIRALLQFQKSWWTQKPENQYTLSERAFKVCQGNAQTILYYSRDKVWGPEIQNGHYNCICQNTKLKINPIHCFSLKVIDHSSKIWNLFILKMEIQFTSTLLSFMASILTWYKPGILGFFWTQK